MRTKIRMFSKAKRMAWLDLFCYPIRFLCEAIFQENWGMQSINDAHCLSFRKTLVILQIKYIYNWFKNYSFEHSWTFLIKDLNLLLSCTQYAHFIVKYYNLAYTTWIFWKVLHTWCIGWNHLCLYDQGCC